MMVIMVLYLVCVLAMKYANFVIWPRRTIPTKCGISRFFARPMSIIVELIVALFSGLYLYNADSRVIEF
jgi:hypothetical protein